VNADISDEQTASIFIVEDEAVYFTETLGHNIQSTRCHNPEDTILIYTVEKISVGSVHNSIAESCEQCNESLNSIIFSSQVNVSFCSTNAASRSCETVCNCRWIQKHVASIFSVTVSRPRTTQSGLLAPWKSQNFELFKFLI
jgi:hypothetical protein